MDDLFRTTIRNRIDLPFREWDGESYSWWEAVVSCLVTGEVRSAWGLSESDATSAGSGLRHNWTQELARAGALDSA